jgi:hypothetical protein
MRCNFTKRAVFGAVGTAAMLVAGAAHAALQDRDLDHNGVTDAYYDTDLNITWLRNANVNGLMHGALRSVGSTPSASLAIATGGCQRPMHALGSIAQAAKWATSGILSWAMLQGR